MHGIDLSQMTSQGSSCTHLDSANGVDIGCDLKKRVSLWINVRLSVLPTRKTLNVNRFNL